MKFYLAIAGILFSSFDPLFAKESFEENPGAKKVYALFESRCASCHGGEKPKGNFGYVLDFGKLRESQLLDLEKPSESILYKLLLEGEMPLRGEAFNADELKTVLDWIQNGAPDVEENTTEKGFYVSDDEVELLALKDLTEQPSQVRSSIRYVSFANQIRKGTSETDYKFAIQALAKLLNSLSWQDQLAVPVAVSRKLGLFRISLRDFGWSESQWSFEYPYQSPNPSSSMSRLMEGTQSHNPLIRADWINYRFSQPPLYNQLLRLPSTVENLEENYLGVRTKDNIDTNRALRAGFRGGTFSDGSGVSLFNRLIERHPLRRGYYWKSFDFSANSGEQDLFSLPLGPNNQMNSPFAFQHAGGEFIFSLPNGLQGYMISDSKGSRLDRAPIEIVNDKSRPDGVITNGISCMSCHSQGIRRHSDQILGYVLQNSRLFSQTAVSKIKSLHRGTEDLNNAFEIDRRSFVSALEKMGVEANALEPIRENFDRFEKPLDLTSAEAELDLRPGQLNTNLFPTLAPLIAQLRARGLARESFESLFPFAKVEIKKKQIFLTENPFFEGARQCNILKVSGSLSKGHKTNERNELGRLALHEAILSQCDLSIIQILINELTDFELGKHDNLGDTPIHAAVLGDLAEATTELLTRSQNQLKQLNKDRLTPLNLSARLGSANSFLAMWRFRPAVWEVVSVCDKQERCPIHWSAIVGSEKVVEDLVTSPNIEINLRDQNQKTAFFYAYKLARSHPQNPSYLKVYDLIARAGGN